MKRHSMFAALTAAGLLLLTGCSAGGAALGEAQSLDVVDDETGTDAKVELAVTSVE